MWRGGDGESPSDDDGRESRRKRTAKKKALRKSFFGSRITNNERRVKFLKDSSVDHGNDNYSNRDKNS